MLEGKELEKQIKKQKIKIQKIPFGVSGKYDEKTNINDDNNIFIKMPTGKKISKLIWCYGIEKFKKRIIKLNLTAGAEKNLIQYFFSNKQQEHIEYDLVFNRLRKRKFIIPNTSKPGFKVSDIGIQWTHKITTMYKDKINN